MTQGRGDPFESRARHHRGRVINWEGHELIELESPELKVVVSTSRGAEILELRTKHLDLDLLWHGHPDVVRNVGGTATTPLPQGNFLDDFAGGWQEILPSAQFPVEYRGARLGQHGEAALLPWSWQLVTDSPDELVIRLSVELRRTPIRVTREMTLRGGALRFEESVENLAATPIDIQWGHHIAFGGPAVGPGTVLSMPAGAGVTIPGDESPSNRFNAGQTCWPHAVGRNTDTTRLDVLPADDGTDGTFVVGPLAIGTAAIRNDELPLVIELDWDATVFPYCWTWMVLGGHPDWPLWGRHRLVTIEPFTSPLTSLTSAVENGQSLVVPANGTCTAFLQVRVDTRALEEPVRFHQSERDA